LKFTLHLNRKNVWVWLFGVSAVVLTTIGIIVPSTQWGVPPWKWIIVGLLLSAVVGATVMLFAQSREDHEREERESKRDAAQETLRTQVAQLAAKGDEKSLAVAQTTQAALSSLSPGVDFKFIDYFRMAHMSQLTE
jgi:membrane protein implicated in regulation of membrane protease activity